jgi:hypothetical protein
MPVWVASSGSAPAARLAPPPRNDERVLSNTSPSLPDKAPAAKPPADARYLATLAKTHHPPRNGVTDRGESGSWSFASACGA